MKFKKLPEWLAHMEHEQWMVRSHNLANSEALTPGRLQRWKSLWKPYAKLTFQQKEQDGEGAEKILAEMPFNVQSGSEMDYAGRREEHAKGFQGRQRWRLRGGFQTSDLTCANCGVVHRFGGFKKKRNALQGSGRRPTQKDP